MKGTDGLTPVRRGCPEPVTPPGSGLPQHEGSRNATYSRTFLRIEGDLVSLVTEVIDREVSLPDLLTELTTATVAMTPRLPTGCRFWIRSGTTDRQVFVLEQPPSRRTIEYHASRAVLQRTDQLSARPAVRRLRGLLRSATRSRGCPPFFRTQPIASLDATLLCSTLPNTSDDGVVCLGSVRVNGRSVGERVDALIGAFWASRFNQDLRRHPLPFSGGFRAWASRSRRPRITMTMLLFIIAAILVVGGIVTIVRGSLLFGILLIVVGLLVGPGGVSLFT